MYARGKTNIADDIQIRVDAVVVVADCPGLAGRRDSRVAPVEDLVWSRGHVVGGCEYEGGVAAVLAPGAPGFAGGNCGSEGGEGQSGSGEESSGMHGCGC